MCKRIVSLLLAVLMLTSMALTALAADYTDNASVSAVLQVAPAGTAITPFTTNTASVDKTAAEVFPAFDYLCTLNMANVRTKFDSYYTSWVSILGYAGSSDRIAALNQELENMQVTGEFTIEITYPNTMTLPAEFLVNNQMKGFDDNAKQIFGNDTRTVTPGSTLDTLTIRVEVVGEETAGSRPGYVLAKNLKDHINTYLADFTLALPGVATTDYGTFTVSGKLTGFTLAAGPSVNLRVDYATDPQWADATVTVNEIPTRLVPTDPGSAEFTLTFDVDGDKTLVAPITKEAGTKINLTDLKIPYQEGFTFDGWYFNGARTNKVTEGFVLNKNMTLYGTFEEAEAAEKLNDSDHFAYIIGYPDGEVKPNGWITREEVATVFFRLLTEEYRNLWFSKTNSFTDVEENRWSNVAISTLANGGVIEGYEDGSFKPGEPITRAEFTAIASRLDTMIQDATHSFTDVYNHWAEEYIANAVAKGWITGYEDGTFQLEDNITRAEAITITNRMMNRYLNTSELLEGVITWPDNHKDDWYYFAIIEATNGHDYQKQEDGIHEDWTSLRANPDWAALEQ